MATKKTAKKTKRTFTPVRGQTGKRHGRKSAQDAKSTFYTSFGGPKSAKRKGRTKNAADNHVPLPILQRRLVKLSTLVQSRTSELGKHHTAAKFGGTSLKVGHGQSTGGTKSDFGKTTSLK